MPDRAAGPHGDNRPCSAIRYDPHVFLAKMLFKALDTPDEKAHTRDMTRQDYVNLIGPFVARLSAEAVKVETPTKPAFSPRARERNEMGAPGVKVSWALALKLDGQPIDDEMFNDDFGGWFRTKSEAIAADWQTFVKAMLFDAYFDFIDYPESLTGLVAGLAA